MTRIAEAKGLSDAGQLAFLLDALTEYAVCMLDAEGAVATWNAGAERISGYRADEILGKPFTEFFALDERASAAARQMLTEAKLTGRSESEGWCLRKDGSRYGANILLQPIHDPAGGLLGYALVTREMTARLAAQEALRDSDRRFRVLVDGVVDYAIYMLDPSGVVTSWNAGAQRLKG